MKRNSLMTAVVAGLASVAGLANAVELNPDGLGQVLIYPYYTVNGGNSTLLSVVNTSDLAKAVKVRFLEGRNSQEVLDFNLYLSAHDVWTATVFSLTDTGAANVLTTDKSCTTPDLRNAGSGVLSDGRHYQPFRNFQYAADGGPATLDRTREGHIELIEMATIVAGSVTEGGVTHVGGTPDDCSVTGSLTNGSTDLTTPSGGLFGSGTIVQPAIGTLYSYNADAIDGFYSVAGTNLWSTSGSVTPSLADARTTGLTAVAYNFSTSSVGGAGALVTSTYASTAAIDAVSSVFTDQAIQNEYIIEAASGSESEWVVTFPTKKFYVNGAAAPIRPFTRKFAAPGVSCAVVGINYWNREEQTTVAVDDFSPPNQIAPSSLCYESNIVSFAKAAEFTGTSKVLGSKLTSNIDPRAAGFESGWARLTFEPTNDIGPHQLRPSSDGDVWYGLPATGFLAVNYINASNGAPGVLANYSGLYRHRATRQCVNAGLACS